jgi:hypothetical protein
MSNYMGLLVPNSGDKTRVLCYECGGGSTKEKTLIVSNDAGRISWYCFRDSCGNRRQYFTGFAETPIEPQEPALRPFYKTMVPLSDEQGRFLKTAYGIDANKAGIRWSYDDNRYLLPINTYHGDNMGWISRRPWGYKEDNFTPKSLTYWHERGPLLAWNARPRYTLDRAPVVLAVEDQLSAIRAHQFLGVATVALLGTGVNQEKIGAIQKHTDSLVIALDKDATGQAFAIARKWGQAFKSCRVLILEDDLKDAPLEKLRRIVI